MLLQLYQVERWGTKKSKNWSSVNWSAKIWGRGPSAPPVARLLRFCRDSGRDNALADEDGLWWGEDSTNPRGIHLENVQSTKLCRQFRLVSPARRAAHRGPRCATGGRLLADRAGRSVLVAPVATRLEIVCKSQLISKVHFVFFNSSKNQMKNFSPSRLGQKFEFSSSFFGIIEDTKKTFRNYLTFSSSSSRTTTTKVKANNCPLMSGLLHILFTSFWVRSGVNDSELYLHIATLCKDGLRDGRCSLIWEIRLGD